MRFPCWLLPRLVDGRASYSRRRLCPGSGLTLPLEWMVCVRAERTKCPGPRILAGDQQVGRAAATGWRQLRIQRRRRRRCGCSVRGHLPAVRARALAECRRRGPTSGPGRRGRSSSVARQAGVDHPPHARTARLDAVTWPTPTRCQTRRTDARYARNAWRSRKPEPGRGRDLAPTSAARRPDKFVPARSRRCRTTGRAASCAPAGSTFDMAGRVFKNKPAPDNLEVPPPHAPVRHAAADRRRQKA